MLRCRNGQADAHTRFAFRDQQQNSDNRRIAIALMKWVCYPSGTQSDMWTEWHGQQNGAVRGRHAAVLRFLIAGHWKEPYYKLLKGKPYKGLGEIRIRGDVEWRLIGHREQSSDTFTVVMICNHKGTVYQPHDALLTAVRKWKEMENGLEGDKLDVHPI